MASQEIKLLVISVVAFFILHDSNAAITPLDTELTGTIGKDVSITWTFDNVADTNTIDWTYKSSSSPTPTTIMDKVGAAAATVYNSFNVKHVTDGSITLKEVTMDNVGIYYCTVAYNLASGHAPVTGTVTLTLTTAPPGCCCCLIDCKDIEIGVCYFANIMIYIIIFVVFSIIVGIVVEAIFNIWEKMSLTWRILSFVFFLFGLGLFIKRRIAANEPDKNDSSNNSPGEIPLSKNQSHVMNTKYANPIGGQPDYAQPLQERPANFN